MKYSFASDVNIKADDTKIGDLKLGADQSTFELVISLGLENQKSLILTYEPDLDAWKSRSFSGAMPSRLITAGQHDREVSCIIELLHDTNDLSWVSGTAKGPLERFANAAKRANCTYSIDINPEQGWIDQVTRFISELLYDQHHPKSEGICPIYKTMDGTLRSRPQGRLDTTLRVKGSFGLAIPTYNEDGPSGQKFDPEETEHCQQEITVPFWPRITITYLNQTTTGERGNATNAGPANASNH